MRFLISEDWNQTDKITRKRGDRPVPWVLLLTLKQDTSIAAGFRNVD